jgi:uncharacterized membrane protein YfcA
VSGASLALVAGIGVLIGTVGLGGFLLVPILVALEGRSTHDAVVVAAVAFLFAGLLSLASWRRRAPDELASHGVFLLAAGPGAIVGALVVGALVEGALDLVIAASFAVAAAAEWLSWPRTASVRRSGRLREGAGGTFAGFASALTGTSGPMVAMPLLAWSGLPLRERIVVGQVAQVPIALGATVMFAGLGAIPWSLAVPCSVALCTGMLASRLVAHRVDASWLRRLAAVLMLAAAITMLVRH